MKTQDAQMDVALHRHHEAMRRLIRSNVDSARLRWGALPKIMVRALKGLSIEHRLSVRSGDLLPLDGRWYVTHTGLLRLARRSRCAGISVDAVPALSDTSGSRWAFRATVYRSKNCKGFVGYGDANPRCQPCPAQGLRHRNLLSRGDWFLCRAGTFLPRAEQAPATTCQRELRRPQSPRPPLPNHSPASARSQPSEVLRHGLLRSQNSS